MQSNVINNIWKRLTKDFEFNRYIVYIIFLLVLILFALVLGKTFFSVNNLFNIIRQTAVISIVCVTMTFVIASGQIDLSLGATIALSGLLSALILRETNNIFLAVFAALLLGAFVGTINGLLMIFFNMPAFLATLGIGGVVTGFAMWITNTVAVPITNSTYNFVFGGGNIGQVPLLLFWCLAIVLIGHCALVFLPYGRRVLAVGGNATSARYSGINVKKYLVYVMMFNGLASGLGGVLYTGRMQTARYSYGTGSEMDVIAAVILGGTAMSGGTGSVIGAFMGSLLLGVIKNGLIIAGLGTSQQTIVKGALIVVAVALSTVGSRRKQNA